MRILIISLPRTGSTSLLEKLSKEHNLEKIDEPYHTNNLGKYDFETINKNNIVLKTIVDQVPKGTKKSIDYWVNESKKFDEVILLSRRDLISCAESLAFLAHHESNGFKHNEKYEWIETPNLNEWIDYLYGAEKQLDQISQRLEIKIKYYEDIYDVNSKERLRINKKNNKLI